MKWMNLKVFMVMLVVLLAMTGAALPHAYGGASASPVSDDPEGSEVKIWLVGADDPIVFDASEAWHYGAAFLLRGTQTDPEGDTGWHFIPWHRISKVEGPEAQWPFNKPQPPSGSFEVRVYLHDEPNEVVKYEAENAWHCAGAYVVWGRPLDGDGEPTGELAYYPIPWHTVDKVVDDYESPGEGDRGSG
jgi:hypothetical protein